MYGQPPAPAGPFVQASMLVPVEPAAPSSVPLPRGPATAVIPPWSGRDDAQSGGATSRLQGVGEAASATGPQDPRASGSRVAETDPHAVLSRPQPSQQGLVLGVLSTLGVGALLLVGYFALAPSAGGELATPPAEPAVARAAEVHQPAVVEPTVPEAAVVEPAVPEDAVPEAAVPEAAVPEPEEADVAAPPPEAPDVAPPSTPKPRAASSKPTSAKPSAPPTDAKVRSKLARALKKKCGSLGSGSKVTVNVLVAADGHVLSKSVVGATGKLQACLVAGVGKAEFPAGKTRTVPIEVSI
jgi:hypothetical protein